MSTQSITPRQRIDVDAIKAELAIEDIVGEVVSLKPQGREEYLGLCPFHSERSPSFTVNAAKGFYHCFGCGAHGDIVAFRMAINNLDFLEAVKQLAFEAGIELPDDDDKGRAKPVERPAAPRINREREDRLERRKAEQQRQEAERFERARRIWREAVSIAGTVTETYLREARGLDLDAIGGAPATLRHAPSLPFAIRNAKREVTWLHFPAMVAAVQGPDGSFIGVHRTFLKADGSGKAEYADPDTGEVKTANKMMLGDAWHGACRLGKFAPDSNGRGRLMTGEGIESCLSVMIPLAKAGQRVPAWAALSRNNLCGLGDREADNRAPFHPTKKRIDPKTGESKGRLRVPTSTPDMARPGIILPKDADDILLLPDADTDPFVNTPLIERAVRRWQNESRQVTVPWPPTGTDFNDWLLKGAQYPS